jgi:uncharacterized protein YyaL (SSP411 family)
MEALQIHAALTGDTEATTQAGETMQILARDALQYPSFAGYGLAVWLTELVGIKEVAVVGVDDTVRAMEDVVWDSFRPDIVVAKGDGSASAVPLLLDRPLADSTLAYVCESLVCGLPVASSEGLMNSLELSN